MGESFDEELDRRESWGPRNVGFGNYCWGYRSDRFCRLGNTSRAPSH